MNLKVKIGCDIANILRFKEICDKQKNSLGKIFLSHELLNAQSIESLAGIFAVKESIIKALEIKGGSWHMIEIIKQTNGKPIAKLDNYNKNIISQDISISHDGEYVCAVSCFLIYE